MIALWLLLGLAGAAEVPALSVAEARRLAVLNNPNRESADLAVEIARIEAARARRDRVSATLGLDAGAGAQVQRPYGGEAIQGTAQDWDLRGRVDVPVYAGGARQAAIAQADAGAQGAALERQVTVRELERAASTAYWTIKGYELQIAAAEEGLARSAEAMAIIEAKANAGLSAGIDVNRSKVDLLSQQEALVSQRAALYSAQQELLRLLQLPGDAVTLTDAPPPPRTGPVSLPEKLGEGRPEKALAASQIAASEGAVKAARAATLPAVGLYAEAGYGAAHQAVGTLSTGALAEPGADASAGLRLTWDPFDLGRSRDRVRQAELRVAQASASAASVDAQITAEIRKAAADLRQLRDRAPLVAQQVALARDNLQIVQDLYGQGSASILDLFNAQSSFRSARSQEAALAVQLATAEDDLLWLLGDELAPGTNP